MNLKPFKKLGTAALPLLELGANPAYAVKLFVVCHVFQCAMKTGTLKQTLGFYCDSRSKSENDLRCAIFIMGVSSCPPSINTTSIRI